jgi:hypothetical protein
MSLDLLIGRRRRSAVLRGLLLGLLLQALLIGAVEVVGTPGDVASFAAPAPGASTPIASLAAASR